MKEITELVAHPYKRLLKFHGIGQTVLAKNLQCSQTWLNLMLNGARPMGKRIESEIQELLDILTARETAKGGKNE